MLDRRIYKANIHDRIFAYIAGNGIPTPYMYALPLGPMTVAKEDIGELPKNGQLSSGPVVMPQRESEEFAHTLGARTDETKRPLAYQSTLGICNLTLLTDDKMNLDSAMSPYINGYRMVPFEAVTCRTFTSPLNLKLLEPVQCSQEGIATFRYMGKEPLYTCIQGSMDFLFKVDTHSTYGGNVLYLRPVSNIPNLIKGDNKTGATVLARNPVSTSEEPFTIRHVATDLMNKLAMPSPEMREAIINNKNVPELFTGHVVGYFNQATTTDPQYDPELVYPDKNNTDEQNAKLKTSNWFPVRGGCIYHIAPLDGTTSRCRVQWRDKTGKIRYHAPNMNRPGADGYIKMPYLAVSARIYYANYTDTVTKLSIKDRSQFANYQTVDPTYGWWQRRTMHVNQPIVLWPGTEYCFSMDTISQVGENINTNQGSFRYESGGFNFLFDATPYLDEISDYPIFGEDSMYVDEQSGEE